MKIGMLLFLVSAVVEAKTCCVCEYLNKPLAMLKADSEARLVPLGQKNCVESLQHQVCDEKKLIPAFGPEVKKVNRKQWKNYKMLGEDVRKKVADWANGASCTNVFYVYHGHSWNDRGKDFIDSSFALKNALNADVVSCTNNGCRTFQDVSVMRKYFAEKCKGDTCSPGDVFQIRANVKDIYPAKKNFTHMTLREHDKVPENQEDVVLPNVRAHGLSGGIEEKVFLIEDE